MTMGDRGMGCLGRSSWPHRYSEGRLPVQSGLPGARSCGLSSLRILLSASGTPRSLFTFCLWDPGKMSEKTALNSNSAIFWACIRQVSNFLSRQWSEDNNIYLGDTCEPRSHTPQLFNKWQVIWSQSHKPGLHIFKKIIFTPQSSYKRNFTLKVWVTIHGCFFFFRFSVMFPKMEQTIIPIHTMIF